MRGRFQPPMLVIAGALAAVMASLAVLQYRWLGHVSDAERDRMTATLNTRAAAFAEDFDRELTLAYTLFQMDPLPGPAGPDSLSARLAARHERWQTTARHPGLIQERYLALRTAGGDATLQRFDPLTSALEHVEWPGSLSDIRRHVGAPAEEIAGRGGLVIRTMARPLWEAVPAILIPSPFVFFNAPAASSTPRADRALAFVLLVLDRAYITGEMLPRLAERHFREADDGLSYRLAVVSAGTDEILYRSTSAFVADGRADATADLFQLRLQEFAQATADVRRFTAAADPAREGHGAPLSLIFEETQRSGDGTIVRSGTVTGSPAVGRARWRLLAVHPSGSLETAIASARLRNLLVSGGVLAVLAASIGLLVASTRRSQELARRQMEFVAAVSHELRTPLAVIRSAGDNLADGTVRDEAQIRRYGALVRSEGRRLTGMVEQILEFAGIHSGQRTLAVAPVSLGALVDRVLSMSGPLAEAARMRIDVDLPHDLPPVAGDSQALARVFQNLFDNAIKYGEAGGWIGIVVRSTGSEVRVEISDRGIGIAAADQARIFEPFYRAADVVSAQIQGAGLGLSLVSRIVEAHGGRISVKSTLGQGASFIVHLPAANGQIAGRHHNGAAAQPLPQGDPGSPHPRTT